MVEGKFEESLLDRSEASFLSMNYHMLFGGNLIDTQLEYLCSRNIRLKEKRKSSFERRLQDSVSHIKSSRTLPSPSLVGWDMDYLSGVRKKYGQVLLALFHFGSHRNVILDLFCLNVKLIAPIAGKAYWDFYTMQSIAPEGSGENIKLLQVEDSSVGRGLFREIKRGRVACIYADGNMGPADNPDSSGTVEVEFFDKVYRVKSGIARTALMMNAAVLPVFCSVKGEDSVQFGKLILAPEKASGDKNEACRRIMQALYTDFESVVKEAPYNWEFALCLHRWLKPKNNHEKAYSNMEVGSVAKVNDCVKQLREKDFLCWVNTQNGKACRFNESIWGAMDTFYKDGVVIFEELYSKSSERYITHLRDALLRNKMIRFKG